MSTRFFLPLCLASLLLTLTSGCGSGRRTVVTASSTVRDAPAQLFRRWQLVHVSGGISGGGYPVTPGMEFITFDRNGNFSHIDRGEVTQGTYQVVIRQTSFSESDLPVILYSSNGEEVIESISDQKLILSYDGADQFEKEYAPAAN